VGTVKATSGFTIVELIVVISVLAILAAISIFSYGAWRENIAKAEVQNELHSAAGAMEAQRNFATTANTGYPTTAPFPFASTDKVTLTYYAATSTYSRFCITGTSVSYPSIVYKIDSSVDKTKAVTGACS